MVERSNTPPKGTRGYLKPKRRTRSPHPGVVLLKPSPGHPTWRARFEDPDLERSVKVRLDPEGLRTAEARREWARKKSRALAKRRMELEAGAPKATGTTVEAALKRYFDDHVQLRPGTLGIYKHTADKFEAWAKKQRIKSADDITGAKLVAFRSALVKEPLRVPTGGAGRGARVETEQRRSATTVNRELRAIGTVLAYVRKLGLLPKVTADDLKDGLEKLKASLDPVEYMRPKALQNLLDGALRHDAAVFAATRDEHAGLRPPGSTPRYEAIAPFIAVVLLTGMRFAEALNLEWSQVDLDALDHDGVKVGEIRLFAEGTKTKRGRTIGLEVSPGLLRLLVALKRKRGGQGRVFAATKETLRAGVRRIRAEYGAPPEFGWQTLRQTCGTYLTNAPGLFGAASAYRSAKQLGHSVEVAEKHYVDVARGISRDARTLEAAMQIEKQVESIIQATETREDSPGAHSASRQPGLDVTSTPRQAARSR